MQREIKVISNSQNRNETYMSDAMTFGELKSELIQKGFEVNDMDFKEGKSRLDLVDESSPLPTNFMYRGEQTSDLVILITPKNTKIKSGMSMSRSELYAQIKSNNLQEEVKNHFGKNFTQVSSLDLENLINAYRDASCTPTPQPVQCECNNSNYTLESLAFGMTKIIAFLESLTIFGVSILSKKTADNLRAALRKDYEHYSEEEIAEMQH